MCMSMSANPSWTLMNLFSYSCYSCEGRCFHVWENSSSKLLHSASSVSDGQSCYKEAAISLQKLRMNKILQKKVVTEIATTGLFLLVYSVSSSISALQGLHLISVSGHLSLIPHFRPGSFFPLHTFATAEYRRPRVSAPSLLRAYATSCLFCSSCPGKATV